MCRPRVVLSPKPFMNIVDGRHPAVSQDTYIPNSSCLGSENEGGEIGSGTFVLLTGPNMGGKSTLMRQIGLITVLAHMVRPFCSTLLYLLSALKPVKLIKWIRMNI